MFCFHHFTFKDISVSNGSYHSGYTCDDWARIHSGRTVYNICKFHARYVSLRLHRYTMYIDGTADLCEVEIYGEYTIDTVLQTDIHALCHLCHLVYNIQKQNNFLYVSIFFSNLRMSHTRTLWWELFYYMPTKLSRKSLWYRTGNVFEVYKWLPWATM